MGYMNQGKVVKYAISMLGLVKAAYGVEGVQDM